MIPIGTLVRLVHQPVQKLVEVGAMAVVVDGPSTFPDKHAQLVVQVGSECVEEEFIFVEWLKNDDKWHGQEDGAYAEVRFEQVVRSRVLNTRKKFKVFMA